MAKYIGIYLHYPVPMARTNCSMSIRSFRVADSLLLLEYRICRMAMRTPIGGSDERLLRMNQRTVRWHKSNTSHANLFIKASRLWVQL